MAISTDSKTRAPCDRSVALFDVIINVRYGAGTRGDFTVGAVFNTGVITVHNRDRLHGSADPFRSLLAPDRTIDGMARSVQHTHGRNNPYRVFTDNDLYILRES